MHIIPHYTSSIKDAKAAEEACNYKMAAKLYEKAINMEPLIDDP